MSLTTGVDNIVGTAGNDTITADNTAGAGKYQLTVADQINGGQGVDTLKIYNATTDAIDTLGAAMAGVSNVEKIYLNNGTLTDAKTLDTSTMSAVTGVTIDSPVAIADTKSFTIKQSATQTLALTNVSGEGAGKIAKINLDGVTDATLNKVGADGSTFTLDLTSTGTALKLTSTGSTASAVTLANTGAKLATLTLAGDTKAATITTAVNTITTVDASGAAAGVKFDTSGGVNAALKFTGGSGADTLTIANASLVKTMTLDGGAGTDTLATDVAAINSTTTAFNQGVNAAKNFEVLGLTFSTKAAAGATASTLVVDASQITSVSTFNIVNGINNNTANTSGANANGVAGATIGGTANTQTFSFDGSMVGQTAAGTGTGGAGVAFAPSIDNGSNVLNLTMNGVSITGGASAGATGTAGNGVNAASYETVNIVSNNNAAGNATANTLAAGAATGGTAGAGIVINTNGTLNVSGSVKMDTGLVAGTNLTINAVNLTGDLVTSTGTGNDTITGGSGKNTITLTGGVDTIDLSKSVAKVDTITTVANGLDALASKFVSITGFTNAATTGDKLDVLNTGSVLADVSNAATGITNLTASVTKGVVTFSGSAAATMTLADAINAVFSTNVLGTTQYKEVAFQYGSDTYVAQQGDTTATYLAGIDLVVKLVGVTGVTELSATASGANTIFAV